MLTLKTYLRQQIGQTLKTLELPQVEVKLEPTSSADFGDLSTNLALALARDAGRPAMELADEIKDELRISSDYCDTVSVTEPGFINFTISPDYLRNQISGILEGAEDWARTDVGKGKRSLVEFVSANPTGPLTVGHGRQAVLGDIVSNILEWHGFDVTREYYYNDAGRQMRLLGESVRARYLDLMGKAVKFPKGGYEGDYIRDIARSIHEKHGDRLENESESPIFKETAEELIFDDIKSTLEKINVRFDEFVNEKTFYENGSIDRVVETLRKRDIIYDKDGAVWFKTTELGKSQDTVLIKGTGEPTYRLPDIAYHREKIERDFDLIVDLFGADHKDAYPDVISAVRALGYSTDHIRVLLHQFVTLKSTGSFGERGEKTRMSTRKATFVTLEDLIDRVGPDVVRYFFIMRGMQSHLNFDLELAERESEENPVYYLQYAHARICNIIKFGEDTGIKLDSDTDLSLVGEPSERDLLKELIRFPEVTEIALETLEPQGIANYLQAVAAHFHKFYVECRVITDDIPLSKARLALVSATRLVLASGLKILGITRPERM
ncbi:MAG: arginine--tRNA ligase [Candidatus Neomarinimicrobiota bacterium]